LPEEAVDDDSTIIGSCNLCAIEPLSFEEAMSSPEAEEWKKAMDEEIATLEERNLFSIVKHPENENIFGSRWEYS